MNEATAHNGRPTNERESSASSLPAGTPGAAESLPEVAGDELIETWELLNDVVAAITIRLANHVEDTASMGLAAFDVLTRLLREPTHRLPLRDLAADLRLTSSGFTRLIDRIELDGHVAREHSTDPHPFDVVVLTQQGDAMVKELTSEIINDLRRHLLEPLGIDGLRTLTDLLRALHTHST